MRPGRRSEGASTKGRSTALRSLRATPDLWRIARILRRHGLLAGFRPGRSAPTPESVRTALEELGPAFVKLGQVLGLRRDLLPDAYVEELERLQDHSPPVDAVEIRGAVEQELEAPLAELFDTFDAEPLAGASIAQVHRARMASGREVVVKVQRPGIGGRVRRDVESLLALAEILTRLVPRVRPFDPVGLVRELERSLQLELDFTEEARNIRRFREVLADVHGLWIPDVVDDRSGRTVLTMEHSPGLRVDRYAAKHPERRAEIARVISALLLRQVFQEGLFHADPHPGNLFILDDGRVCLHDFGMVGRLGDRTRSALERLLRATVRRDVRGAADAYLEMGIAGEDLSRVALEEELSRLIGEIHARPSKEVSVGQALESLVRLGSRHGLRNPAELLLLTRAFLITEGVLRAVDPEVDVIELFREQVGELEARRLGPGEVSRRAGELAVGVEAFLRESPGDARRMLRRLADGTLGRVHAPQLEGLLVRGSRAVERLTGGVIAASFIVGGALLTGLDGWHHRTGVILLWVGVALALWVGLGALRRG